MNSPNAWVICASTDRNPIPTIEPVRLDPEFKRGPGTQEIVECGERDRFPMIARYESLYWSREAALDGLDSLYRSRLEGLA
jgi:hypothetical protein